MNDQSGPPLDDLGFLADLDRGLDLERGLDRGESTERAADWPMTSGSERSKLRRSRPEHDPDRPGTQPTHRRRPLLELFQPGPVEPSAPRPPISARPRVPAAAPPRVGPSRPRLVAPGGRPTYEVFYGLNERPFNPTPDSRFLYHSTAHDRAAHEMLAAIERRDAAVMLIGAAGSGKTTLCRSVIDELDFRTFTSLVPDSFVTIEDLLKTVLLDFGVISRADLAGGRLSDASQYELTIALKEFLLSLMPLGAFAVIFVDNAQNLSAETLEQVRRLADLERDKQLVQLVLLGEPSLLTLFTRPNAHQVKERVTARFDLEALTEDEIAGYVLHRLVVSGEGPSRVEFDTDAFTLIYELSRGNPRLVNRICDRVLTLGYEQSASVIDAALVQRAASDLTLIPPAPSFARAWRVGAAAAALVALMLVGAVAATFVFSTRMQRVVAGWLAIPPAPPPPSPRMVRPVERVPVSEDGAADAGVGTPPRSLR